MNYKVYASDVGFGHLVRQKAIAEKIRTTFPDINIDLQTSAHLEEAKWLFNLPRTNYINKFNNITWARKANGEPDVSKIKALFLNYLERSNDFIISEKKINEYSFVISDFVYEAFPVAARYNVPSFGVAHFTWDWFFSKIYPYPLAANIQSRFTTFANSADRLFFPPFTPKEIIEFYGPKAESVPFIVREGVNPKDLSAHNDKIKILVMDSGANVLSRQLSIGLSNVKNAKDFIFFTPSEELKPSDNVVKIEEKHSVIDFIPSVDLVVSRGGFNTISECIAYRTPLLVLGESANPEMDLNMITLKKLNLGSFMSLENLNNGLESYLTNFFETEYLTLKENMQQHELRVDGAKVIANKIAEYISK